ncbi:hypothetical protein A9404_09210 [Halothiobacillus diazotrophicus]|uniref:Diguanylate cyclase n=1 Tax=Halothiobacillus diazotrophicus TaxID=1860122 RepID=A0A191ZI63_9GAMM|nr:GGDEF and EAL domain-containing protein [Halothiobacillus diazotrophicus]ANJ67542.1 hypothetical protein A9404_09210 [Halothiobacillus diazotrophicus]
MLPVMTDYADAWLWIDLEEQGQIRAHQVITQTGKLHDLPLILDALGHLDAWSDDHGRHGPTEGTRGWVWRVRWLALTHLGRWASPHTPQARLLHVSAYPRLSEDAIGWLDRLPDFVIGRDEQQATVFLNKAANDARDESLIAQLTRQVPAFSDTADAPMELSVQDRTGKTRIFQRQTIQAPPSAALHDFILAHEITAMKALEHALSDNERLMRTLIDATPDFIVIKDADSRWLLANESALDLCHLQDIAWWGKTDDELAAMTHPMYRATFARYSATDLRAWETGRLVRTMDTLPLPGGRTRVFDTLKLPLFEIDGRRKVLVIIGRDVTERQEAQARYQNLASQDELTGLLNRRCFQLEAQRWIDELKREKSSQKLALVMFDLDYFRSVNDSYGHARGDRLLQEMAHRLQHECTSDQILIARMGGDEFALLLPADNAPTSLDALGARIKEITARPFVIDGVSIFTSASTGIVLWPDHGQAIHEMLHQADSAMYEAKELGRNSHAVFSPHIAELQNWRSDLLTALRSGLTENRFRLVYQVQQNANSLAITGVEALLRWSPPRPDLAARPDQFVPLLEQSGLIIEVGGWVLHEACRQAAAWRDQLGERISVAVNISSVQLHAPCFVDRIRSALGESNINPDLLELELTESSLVIEPAKAAATLAEVKALGVQLALDDFGTGYSSLSYLTRFSFDRLKIDQGFVRDIFDDPKDLEIVKAIIAMGHALGLEVVAEGVETVDERDLLEGLGCDSFQGYLVGRPGKPEEISSMLGVGLL